jgi:outer membrane protein TolC
MLKARRKRFWSVLMKRMLSLGLLVWIAASGGGWFSTVQAEGSGTQRQAKRKKKAGATKKARKTKKAKKRARRSSVNDLAQRPQRKSDLQPLEVPALPSQRRGRAGSKRKDDLRRLRVLGRQRKKTLSRRKMASTLGVKKELPKKTALKLEPSPFVLLAQAPPTPEVKGDKESGFTVKQPPLVPRKDANDPELSLQEVHNAARQQNLDLQILRERVIQAELLRYKTWAILKPTIALQGIYTRNQVEAAFSTGGALAPLLSLFRNFPIPPQQLQQLEEIANSPPTVIQPINQLIYQLQLNWGFFNLRAIPLLQVAYLAVDQMEEVAKQTRREIVFAATRAYYTVLLTDGLVDIARQNLQNAEERLLIAQAQFQAGVTPSLTVTRAELDVVSAKQNLIQSETGLRNTKLALALLLNKREMRFRPKQPPAPTKPEGDLKGWTERAAKSREEIKAAHLAMLAAEKNVTEVWMRFMPTVALQALLRGGNFRVFGTDQNSQWSVSLVASINLYEGGNRYASLQENESKLRQARLELAKARRQVENEVATALLSIENSRASLQTARQQVLLAQRSYALTQERYKTGVATPVEVSDANAVLNSSKINLLRETLNYEVAVLSLQRAIGEFKLPPVDKK